jgi:transmembrane sensor
MKRPEKKTPSSASNGSGEDWPTRALDWVVPSGGVDLLYEEVAAQLRRRRLMSVSLVCAVLLGGAGWWQMARPSFVNEPAAAAIVSAPARQVLPDGSVIELNQGARVRVEFSETVRRVRLQQGEAHFQVAKNVARPFIVVAGEVEVRAVGTAFSVDLGAAAVDVLVTEGEVAVEKAPAPVVSTGSAAPIAKPNAPAVEMLARLPAGNRVSVNHLKVSSPLVVVPVSAMETNQRMAWRAPRVDFSGASLTEVVAVFNQHAEVQISIGDRNLAGLELSGVLRADNVDSLLQLLADEFKISAVHTANGIVLRAP